MLVSAYAGVREMTTSLVRESAMLLTKLVIDATLKVYPGAPHGLAATHTDELNADLLVFIKG
jgi:non-heme chloroperoxidase